MLGAAIIKDLHLLRRDVGALASLFLLPVIFIAVFGSMFGGGRRDEARVLPVYHAASDPLAARAVAAVDRSGAFRVQPQDSPDRVRALVASGDADVGLILPPGFDPGAGVPAELVIDEAASPMFRGPVEGAVRGALWQATRPGAGDDADDGTGPDIGAGRPVVVARTPPGMPPPLPHVGGFQLSVPGNAVLFGFFLALTVALSFVDERRSGTWRRLLAAPVRRPVVLLAKLVPYVLVGLVQMAFLFGIGAAVFGMRVGGSVVALVALTAAVVFCAAALGLLLASLGGTEKQLGAMGSILLLVMGMLGGAMVPRVAMPATLKQIGLATPHAWALDGYFDILVRDGTTAADVATPIGVVVAFGVVFAAVGAARFRFER